MESAFSWSFFVLLQLFSAVIQGSLLKEGAKREASPTGPLSHIPVSPHWCWWVPLGGSASPMVHGVEHNPVALVREWVLGGNWPDVGH